MNKTIALVSTLTILMLMVASVPARVLPQTLSREKRQSDQRLAELETLLALQKYRGHRFRTDRKKGVGADGEHPPGYGIIDFRMLGRKKKSTRFSPGELEIGSSKETFHPPTSFQSESSWVPADEDRSFYPESDPISDVDETRQEEAAPLLYIEKK